MGAIETVGEFGPRIGAEAVRWGLHRATEVIVLGAAALWILNLAQEHFPAAVHIVDLYHAREHLADISKLVFGTTSEHAKAWVAARRDQLDDGEVETTTTAITELPTSDPRVQDELRKAVE